MWCENAIWFETWTWTSKINTCFTAGKQTVAWNCQTTPGHRKTTIFTSIVYGILRGLRLPRLRMVFVSFSLSCQENSKNLSLRSLFSFKMFPNQLLFQDGRQMFKNRTMCYFSSTKSKSTNCPKSRTTNNRVRGLHMCKTTNTYCIPFCKQKPSEPKWRDFRASWTNKQHSAFFFSNTKRQFHLLSNSQPSCVSSFVVITQTNNKTRRGKKKPTADGDKGC